MSYWVIYYLSPLIHLLLSPPKDKKPQIKTKPFYNIRVFLSFPFGLQKKPTVVSFFVPKGLTVQPISKLADMNFECICIHAFWLFLSPQSLFTLGLTWWWSWAFLSFFLSFSFSPCPKCHVVSIYILNVLTYVTIKLLHWNFDFTIWLVMSKINMQKKFKS